MKRSLIVGCISSLAILSGLAACGKAPVACDGESLTNGPQACPDRASLGFAQEFGSGTFIGMSVQEALRIQNGGIGDLNISAVTFSGDSAFTVNTEPSTVPASIKGNKNFFIRVLFAPTEAKAYSGKITVQSNAELSPSLQFDVSGCGVPADGGTSPCYRDGGR